MNFETTLGVGTEEGDQYRISLFGFTFPINKYQTEDI